MTVEGILPLSFRHMPPGNTQPLTDSRFRVHAGRAIIAHPLHAHPEYQVGLVDGGTIEYFVAGVRHEARPGEVVCIDGGVPHYARSRGPGSAAFVLVFTAPALLDEVAEVEGEQRGPSFRHVVTTDQELTSALRTVAAAALGPTSRLAREVAATAALSAIARQRTQLGGSTRASRTGERTAVRRALDYLHDHTATDVSLDALARAAHLSKYRLVRAFGTHVGQPPHAYQIHLRVSLALRLLARGLPVSRVALEAGFSDHSHLTRTFRRTLGVTPAKAVRR
ncbi:MAG TPA: AraC family transcriptional regulator [Gemmatimonas sp.]|nr:AraC family transcriptional regulator [Gemmatimonas sp.]